VSTFASVVAFLATMGYVTTALIYAVGTALRRVVPFGILWTEIGCALIALVAHVAFGHSWQAALDVVLAILGVVCLTLRIRLQELRDGHRAR
jgi:hypothetical protein